jgi:hypothetical protein
VSAKAEAAYRALVDAMDTITPSCSGDTRFIEDDTSHDAELVAICAQCPLLALCNAYRIAERPTGALYAGKRPQKNRLSRKGLMLKPRSPIHGGAPLPEPPHALAPAGFAVAATKIHLAGRGDHNV